MFYKKKGETLVKTLKMQTRRDWLKASIGLGGLVLSPNISLTAKEIENYRKKL